MANSRFKFRAWQEWVYYKYINNGEMVYFAMDDLNQSVYLKCNAIIMQYTGLKDKNGVEIYEGDIVKAIETGGVDEVKWEDGKEYCIGFGLFSCFAYEIIGNIYENKELLEV